MNCNVKWNGENVKIGEIKISVIFEFEWNRQYFSGENCDWLNNLRAGESIWDSRKRNRTLRGLCVDSILC
jgi:hypothetical protein